MTTNSKRSEVLNDPRGTVCETEPLYIKEMVTINTAGGRFEDMPCYKVLSKAGLLECKYRVGHGDNVEAQISARHREEFLRANSSGWKNWCLRASCNLFSLFLTTFEVPSGHVMKIKDGSGEFLLAGEGPHCYFSPFITTHGPLDLSSSLQWGDWSVAVVEQGCIGLALDKGNPVLLPPGFHQWKNSTLRFKESITLDKPVIPLGPFTLLTVNEGYVAVTQNNGKQEVMEGGMMHLLKHKNHKFQMFLSTKYETDDLQDAAMLTSDNIALKVQATVMWHIVDVGLAAKHGAETMGKCGRLHNNILRQAEASLSWFVGKVQFADGLSVAALVQKANTEGVGALQNANASTEAYGVELVSLNIVNVVQESNEMADKMVAGAIAAAKARREKTIAHGKAAALRVTSLATSIVDVVRAQAEAEASLILERAAAARAETQAAGNRTAANIIQSSPVALELERLKKMGGSLTATNTLLFIP
eukprot:TRINITY_DN27810_c0_g1_i1.p1 TRINITY_DN27810_c0_g1~~TRINITY_DN27810_c0_g1_i1.p1  ORF type:complete len:475 (+),score=135.82 TRINITY_DN27810_c0_g1_i1:46-1470(+)